MDGFNKITYVESFRKSCINCNKDSDGFILWKQIKCEVPKNRIYNEPMDIICINCLLDLFNKQLNLQVLQSELYLLDFNIMKKYINNQIAFLKTSYKSQYSLEKYIDPFVLNKLNILLDLYTKYNYNKENSNWMGYWLKFNEDDIFKFMELLNLNISDINQQFLKMKYEPYYIIILREILEYIDSNAENLRNSFIKLFNEHTIAKDTNIFYEKLQLIK